VSSGEFLWREIRRLEKVDGENESFIFSTCLLNDTRDILKYPNFLFALFCRRKKGFVFKLKTTACHHRLGLMNGGLGYIF